MIERYFFGGENLNACARELGLTRARAERLLFDGQKRLKDWMESGWEPPEVGVVITPDPTPPEPEQCEQETEWGRCSQPVVGGGLCVVHQLWFDKGITPDPAYHKRIVEGHRPVESFLSSEELETLVNGRYRGDGRRLDQYIAGDPLGFQPRRKVRDDG